MKINSHVDNNFMIIVNHRNYRKSLTFITRKQLTDLYMMTVRTVLSWLLVKFCFLWTVVVFLLCPESPRYRLITVLKLTTFLKLRSCSVFKRRNMYLGRFVRGFNFWISLCASKVLYRFVNFLNLEVCKNFKLYEHFDT